MTIRFNTAGSHLKCTAPIVSIELLAFVLTIFGFAGAVVWLQQVTLHAAADVAALSISACLTASPVHITLIEI